jgi:tripartite-type tricarboxylate transporter receptor subunit TctC
VKLPRRQFLHLAAGSFALPAVSSIASAQIYPTRPVRLIVGVAPGGVYDIMARLIGHWLSERLGQQFIVENRAGAGGNVGTEMVVHAPADGYTLLLAGSNDAINATLYERLNFNFIRDIVPVAGITVVPNVVVVSLSVQANTLPEFIAYAKANPGAVNMASAGTGSPNHMSGELFKAMTGVNMVHVPYRGGAPALNDLIAGQVQVTFSPLPTSIEHIKGGRVRALAVTTASRWPALPDIPTVAEFVPGYEASTWTGVGAPRGTPAEIVDRLNKEINAGLADPRVKAQLFELGGTALPGSPADFAKLIAAETEKWRKVVKFSGVKAE